MGALSGFVDSISVVFTYFQQMLLGLIQWLKVLITIPTAFLPWLSTGVPSIFISVFSLAVVLIIVLRIFGR